MSHYNKKRKPINHDEEQNKFQPSFIPDISYYLVFSFLKISDLSRVARCNQEWRRLVTDKTFSNMYISKETFVFHHVENKINALSLNPMRHLIHRVKTDFCSSNTINQFVNFSHLHSLDIEMMHTLLEVVDLNPLFQALTHKLRFLRLYISSSIPSPPFPFAIHLLTGLTSLIVIGSTNEFLKDVSYLYNLKQLEQLQFTIHDQSQLYDLIPVIRSLPCLKKFQVSHSDWDSEGLLDIEVARQLFKQPGAPNCLKELECSSDMTPQE
jgi:hypothetical protein